MKILTGNITMFASYSMNRLRHRINSLIRSHWGMGLILVIYFILSLLYNWASPIFEPPDEATHFRYVKYLLDHRTLPILSDDFERNKVWGLHQPPLYFFVSAILAYPFDLVAPNDFLLKNPHINRGFAQRPGNKNFYIHTEAEDFPYRGLPLIVRYLRLFSMVCGAVTLIIVYMTGLALFVDQKSLAVVPPALMTLHPEFVFINNEIANEPLNITLMAAGMWGGLSLIKNGPSTRLAIFLGTVAGLIVLAKMTGLALILLLVMAMLIAALRGHSAINLWRLGLIISGLLLIIGGWWYIRNLAIYGDPWQAGMYRDFYGEVQRTISFRDWYYGILAGEVSFWAAFGWFNILAPEWIYTFYKGFLRLGLLGTLIFWGKWFLSWSGIKRRPFSLPCVPYLLLFLLAFPLVSSLILIRLIATEGGIQGRQLLPMLPALSCLLVLGYRSLLPERIFPGVMIGGGFFMLLLTSAMPFLIIAPAYARPKLLLASEFPADMLPLERQYGGQIELLGYKLEAGQLAPGQRNVITLYWRALQPITKNYTVFIHGLGRNMEKVGQYNGYSGLGNFPTGLWPVGKIIEDRYEFIINAAAATPTRLRLHAGFFEFERLDLPPLIVRDAQGYEVSTLIAEQILSSGPGSPPACTEVNVNFTDHIRLTCYQLLRAADEAHPFQDDLILYWQVTDRPQYDYTVFIQVWQNGEQVTGFDGPPFGNDLPTSYWHPDIVDLADRHVIDWERLPPGDYQLLVGLYNAQTGERLSAFSDDGQPLPDYAFDLGQITLFPKDK